MSTILNLATPSTHRAKTSASISAKQYEQLTPAEQVRQAFQPGCRLQAMIGLLLGGSIPGLTFALMRFVLPHHPDNSFFLWVAAAAGLVSSIPALFSWGVATSGSKFEGVGMVIMLEGVMVLSPGLWLPLSAALAVAIANGIYLACRGRVRW